MPRPSGIRSAEATQAACKSFQILGKVQISCRKAGVKLSQSWRRATATTLRPQGIESSGFW
jgi:hypothetical protein